MATFLAGELTNCSSDFYINFPALASGPSPKYTIL